MDVIQINEGGMVLTSKGTPDIAGKMSNNSWGNISVSIQWAIVPGNIGGPSGEDELALDLWGFEALSAAFKTSHAKTPAVPWTKWDNAIAKGDITVTVEWDYCRCPMLKPRMVLRSSSPIETIGPNAFNKGPRSNQIEFIWRTM